MDKEIRFKVAQEDVKTLKKLAKQNRISLSGYVRMKLLSKENV